MLAMTTLVSAEEAPVPLAWINGEPITTEDLDALILSSHQGRDMSEMTSVDLPNFLNKAVNDRLLLGDALAMGMDEEAAVKGAADAFLEQAAKEFFVAAEFHPPTEVEPADMRAYFEKYYWRILLRQVSVRTRESADSLRQMVVAGADMDSLARVRSLDTRRGHGGLHNLKYWGDVENVLRDAVFNVDNGGLSEIFPFRESFAFLRVEERQGLHEEIYPEKEDFIRSVILNRDRTDAWTAFVDSLDAQSPVETVPSTLEAIRADAGLVFMGEFLREQPEPAMSLEGLPILTGTELRREISHTAMVDGTAPFDSILRKAVGSKRQSILLTHHARLNGYFEDEGLLKKRWQRMEQLLIEAYLQELIVPRIVFNREEFQDFYDGNPDRFRGADEVKLDMVIINEREEADDMAARLSQGADFDFLRSQYLGDLDQGSGSVRWVSESVFAGSIQDELKKMDTGQSSQPVETRGGWLIFKLLGRRKGAVKPLGEVEMQIREIMFHRKFTELLDEHLALLKERSEIRMNQEAIDEYFGQGS